MEASPAERALADRRMREVNESWNVLRDAGRRRAYDDSRLRGPAGRRTADRPGSATRRAATPPSRRPSAGPPVEEDEDLVDVMPPMSAVSAGLFRHLPWVVLLVVFGLIFVLTAYAGTDDPTPDPGPQVEAGTCLDLRPGPVTTIVSCEGAHDLEVVDRVRTASACPAGSEARRLGDDAVIDCVLEGPATGRGSGP
jgi:hypothetical protein